MAAAAAADATAAAAAAAAWSRGQISQSKAMANRSEQATKRDVTCVRPKGRKRKSVFKARMLRTRCFLIKQAINLKKTHACLAVVE
jgi:hypothetical protein